MGQPLDTLRIRMQQRAASSCGVVATLQVLVKKEGIGGMFRGMTYPLYTSALQVRTAPILSRHPEVLEDPPPRQPTCFYELD